MAPGPCLYNESNPNTVHVDMDEPFTLQHDLVLVIFWTVYFISLSTPFLVNYFKKIGTMRERISMRRYINRKIREAGAENLHMERLASGRVSFKARFQIERNYKVDVMRIVNDATPPMPLHELEKFGLKMKRRASLHGLARRADVLSVTSTTKDETKQVTSKGAMSAIKKASAKVHPLVPEVMVTPQEGDDKAAAEERSLGAPSEADSDDSTMFVPIPYGIRIDRAKMELVTVNGVQGIIVRTASNEDVATRPGEEGSESGEEITGDDREAAVDYSFRQLGRRPSARPEELEPEPAGTGTHMHMQGLMAKKLSKRRK